jgi:hypothetical protein
MAAFENKPLAGGDTVIEAAAFARGDEYHPKWPEANRLPVEALQPVIGQGQQTAREATSALVPRLNVPLRSG